MRVYRLVASIILFAAAAAIGMSEARAFSSWIVNPLERTSAYVRPGGPPMSSYGAKIHAEIFSEIRRTDLPFRLTARARVVVKFAVDRRGSLTHLSLMTKTGSKLVDDYATEIVRRASRRFPPLPADQPGDGLGFAIPISLE